MANTPSTLNKVHLEDLKSITQVQWSITLLTHDDILVESSFIHYIF